MTAGDGAIAGVWRLGPGSVTLVSIREVEGTVEWRERTYNLQLEPDPRSPLAILKLRTIGIDEVEFEASAAEDQHGRLFRMGLRRTDKRSLRITFAIPDPSGTWTVVRDEEHRRSA